MKRWLSLICLVALLAFTGQASAVFTGPCGVWANKRPTNALEYASSNFPGTQAGFDAAKAFVGTFGTIFIYPGCEGTITVGTLPDSVTVIEYSGGRVVTHGTAVTPRLGPYSSPTTGGAIRIVDGVTFQLTSAGYQAALDEVQAAGGGKVIAPSGTSTLTSTLHIYTDNVSLEGSATGATVFNFTGGDTAIVFATTSGFGNNHRLANLTILVGAPQSGPLVQVTGDNFFWSIENVTLLQSASFAVGTGLRILNCQNGYVSNLNVRTTDLAHPWAYCVDLDINDAAQRGNMTFVGGMLNNGTTGIAIARSGPANSVNNCNFFGVKFVNSLPSLNGTYAADLYSQADQTAFVNCQFERFETAIRSAGSDGLQVVGGIFSQIHNDANNSGTCVYLSGSDGAFISAPRVNDVYNVVAVSGVSQRVYYFGGLTSNIAGSEWTDTSSGANGNFFQRGQNVETPVNFDARVIARSGFGFGAGGTPLTVTSNTITATKGYHQIANSGGPVTVKTINGLNDGDVLLLIPNSDSNIVTLDETGNLYLNGGCTLLTSRDAIWFLKVGSFFMELGRSANSGNTGNYLLPNGLNVAGTFTAQNVGLASDTLRVAGRLDMNNSVILREGVNIASATTITIGNSNFYTVTGTTTCTDIAGPAMPAGKHQIVTFYTTAGWQITGGNHWKINGNFNGNATGNKDALTVDWDGTDATEVGRVIQ